MSIQAVASTNEGVVTPGTLREAIEIRRVRGARFTVREAVAILVPLCAQISALHAEGRSFFVHPSALMHGAAGTELDVDRATSPTHARDRATVAPECRKGDPGNATASVFSLGAIFYELVTGESVGPGMKRPRQVDPGLPPTLEVVLSKALVADPRHRPHDIGALAQAFHQVAPAGSMPPPPADASHLDHDDGFDVDLSLSMLPPAPSSQASIPLSSLNSGPISSPNAAPSQPRIPNAHHSSPGVHAISSHAISSPFLVAEAPPSRPNLDDPTVRLAALKARLESDPRPRYVVVKDGMDHGPFTAVELLQQIASHSFVGEHPLRDSETNLEKPIADWEEFSLFAQQAGLNREIKQERKALEAVVKAEKHRTQWKALVGVTLLAIIGAAGAGWWLKERARSKNEQIVREDKASNVDSDAALSGRAEDPKKPGGAVAGGGGGKYPVVSGGSCQAAQAAYVNDYTQQGVPPDLTQGAYANVLNKGSYLNACGVPETMSVSVCAAVQNGRAVGITVVTNPSNPGIAGCIRGQVAGLPFPSHPRLDVATTTFAAVK
ncbi:MAG: hypothetical protein HOW73_01390 [Polyangiaceae bacterium]|nr:hypothetical protein [Polyangiaceae bacterium]